MNNLQLDYIRYGNDKKKMPKFQYYLRKVQSSKGIMRKYYHAMLKRSRIKVCVDIAPSVKIGGGLYFGHAYCITINPHAVIGQNCNIHKCVTIGRENRGKRQGVPTIGNNVWIGIGAIVVGNITVGDDVMIAPNAFVNCDIPSHSIVIGNPCVIKPRDNATENYIENTI